MMKKSRIWIPAVIFTFGLFALASCDVIDDPIKDDGGPVNPPSDTVYRNVFIEDFTGHRCKNCPKASKVLEQLAGVYGERLIALGIHSGPSEFTAPSPPDYPSDFRTADGDAIAAFFGGVPAQPIGMVNRLDYTGSGVGHFKIYQSWGAEANALIDQVAICDIDIASSVVGSNIQTDVDVIFIGDQNGDYNVAVYLKENDIVAPQLLSDDTRDENYAHQHVFRRAITSPMGEALAGGVISDSTEVSKTYSTPLDSEWNTSNLQVVCIVYDISNQEVMQAMQADVQ